MIDCLTMIPRTIKNALRFGSRKFRGSRTPALLAGLLCAAAALALAGQAPPPAARPGQDQPAARPAPALRTPLSQEVLTLLANEVSGQFAFNNMIRLAGAPWVRDPKEFSEAMEETRTLYDLVRGYGIETVRIERYPGTSSSDYPLEGELWTIEPEKRLLARIGADAALVSRGTKTCDVTGELVYMNLTAEQAKAMREAGPQERYKGCLALVGSPGGAQMAALDAAGFAGIVAFNAQDRFNDPDQVLYSSAPFGSAKNLVAAMAVSWRQWSELFELLQSGRKVVVRARARIEKFPDKTEAVYAWIPGTEPDKKGVIFTAHLFEGFLKRGADDNMSGCVVELEILRALSKLIASGDLPRPRRTIHFLWPNEISGTFEFLKRNPGLAGAAAVNINMDMVGEGLRRNNSWLTMSECPNHLPSFFDGLARAVLNYVWRTNDIVYLNDGPRSLLRGQVFPRPLWEKNGSRDAFRFFVHPATGGSDHLCFNNPAVAVPGIEFFTWPDQWYHTDADTPDKADPTQMKRIAFIGAAAAWAAARCDDAAAAELAEAVSRFGYQRVAEREIPRALAKIDAAEPGTLGAAAAQALNILRFGARREIQALRSIDALSTGSQAAAAATARKIRQWELYAEGLKAQALAYAAERAAALGVKAPAPPRSDALRSRWEKVVPALGPAVKSREFNLSRFEPYTRYLKDHPEALSSTGLSGSQTAAVLNYLNGRNSVAAIRDDASADLDTEMDLRGVAAFIEILVRAGYAVLNAPGGN